MATPERVSTAAVAVRRAKTYRRMIRFYQLLRYPEYRARDAEHRADFRRFCREEGGLLLRHDFLPRGRKPKLALMVRNVSLPYAKIEAVLMKALQMAGYETVVLAKRQFEFLRYEWLAGCKTGYTFEDFGRDLDERWIDEQLGRLRTLSDWLSLEYEGVQLGRIVVATAMRFFKVGRLDFENSEVKDKLRYLLQTSTRNTDAARTLLDTIHPDCVFFLDRGYSGQGEISDLAINRGIQTISYNLGHKSNRLVFKRYFAENRREHPLTPSRDTWDRIRAMPWKREYGDEVRRELFECYETQDWFSGVGTQFDKKILSRENTRERLGLSPDRKVAVIFPHILWDGSFFFGEDLFENYTEWLVETVRAACQNDRLDWVVKLHPAHLVKSRVDSDRGKPAELTAIAEAVATLPAHIKLVHPETDLSTYSLFEIADYAITVRGTVGIESALFGIQTVTAGTGRYDRRGFTLDSSTREEYLKKLAALETYPRLTPAELELAERYAYAAFLCRPLRLESVTLTYDRDGKATPRLMVNRRTREEWLAARDMQRLASWFADAEREDMLFLPGES